MDGTWWFHGISMVIFHGIWMELLWFIMVYYGLLWFTMVYYGLLWFTMVKWWDDLLGWWWDNTGILIRYTIWLWLTVPVRHGKIHHAGSKVNHLFRLGPWLPWLVAPLPPMSFFRVRFPPQTAPSQATRAVALRAPCRYFCPHQSRASWWPFGENSTWVPKKIVPP